ncbi:MAG: type I-U CRISPR-associated protein Csb2 [Pirellulaceae bacterium]|nr:type I-U CRISPR-associated protein Csb2 [Pirellulaceae bacterium]
MLAIQLKFLTGKWHATPWGRQVNEGAVEWPPSPWRLFRALLSLWHHKCSDVPEEKMRKLLSALKPLPSFYLPPASQGHTRHYMPVGGGKVSKVFDTFITISPDSSVLIVWEDLTLDTEDHSLLKRLLSVMGYFGRAESWVEATVLGNGDFDLPEKVNTVPHADEGEPTAETDLVQVLTKADETDHQLWHELTLQKELTRKLETKQAAALAKGKDPNKVKLAKKEQEAVEASLPQTLFEALHAESADLRKGGWNYPPGSRFTLYHRPEDTFRSYSSGRANINTGHRTPTVARFAIAGKVLPSLTNALEIGEAARSTILRQYIKAYGETKEGYFLAGKDNEGNAIGLPTKGALEKPSHQHPHYLCEANKIGVRGKISHLTVYMPAGFSPEVQSLLSTKINHIYRRGGYHLQLIFLGMGGPQNFGGINESIGQSPILSTATEWVSRTPFVPTRHLKFRAEERGNPKEYLKALEGELRKNVEKELEYRNFPNAERIELSDNKTILGSHNTPWHKFSRKRKNGHGHHGGSQGYGLLIRFSKPFCGPLALGYGSHFGLGQFVPKIDP